MNNIKFAGIGAYLPTLVLTNDKISEFVETNDEWIRERTGIKERRVSRDEETSDMAVKAAMLAMERADISPENLELIIVATVSPDETIPSTSCIVQSKIKAENAACFDINAACSGFVYGLEIARGLMQTMNYENALVIGAEMLSKEVDWNDRGTCILFGDGAGAAILKKSDTPGIIKTYLKAKGEKGDSLTVGGIDFESPFVKEKRKANRKIEMNGREVFRFATTAMGEAVLEVIKGTGISLDEIKYIVPHQANKRIIEYVAKKLKMDIDKFYINVDRVGNTSSASIPLALNEMYEQGFIQKGDKIILVAFGGGLTYAATIIEW